MDPLTEADPVRIGRYVLHGRLGAGGMGTVYLGSSGSGRTVALKVIRPEFAADHAFRARFRREAEALRHVSGAFAVPLVDADPEAEVPWLASAYVPSISLQQAVAGHGPLREPQLRAVTAGLAEALQSIHAAGVLHRDLKPGNVLLGLDGPYVIDFGIAWLAEATVLTPVGALLGTPAYMSPEQARGSAVNPASDVFSLGAAVVFAASGRPPFGTEPTTSLLRRLVHDEPDLSAVPDELRLLIAACLSKAPADRPAPGEILQFIEREGTPVMTGTWLPPVLIAAIEEAAADVSPMADVTGSRPRETAGAGAPMPGPAPGDRSRVFGRRKALLATAGAAFILGTGAAGAVLAETRRQRQAPVNLTQESRSLATSAVARPRWTVPVGDDGLIQITGTSDVVVAVSEQAIYGVSAAGRRLWGPVASSSGTGMTGIFGVPAAVAGGSVFAVSSVNSTGTYGEASELRSISLADGHAQWSLQFPWATAPGATLSGILDGQAYLVAGTTPSAGGDETLVAAVDLAARRVRWTRTVNQLWIGVGLMLPSSGSRLLLVESPTTGQPTVTGLDASAGGQPLWQQPAPDIAGTLDTNTYNMGSDWYDGPHSWAAGNFLYLNDGLYAINPANGQITWSATPGIGLTAVVASPDESVVYAAGLTDTSMTAVVYAYDSRTGAVRWAGSLPAGEASKVALQQADGNVYLWAGSQAWALDPATGAARWNYQFAAGGLLTPVPFWAGGGQVYGLTGDDLTALPAT